MLKQSDLIKFQIHNNVITILDLIKNRFLPQTKVVNGLMPMTMNLICSSPVIKSWDRDPHPIATSRGFPAELGKHPDIFRALSERLEKLPS